MIKKKVSISPLFFDTYLQIIKQSPKTKIFRNFFATVNGKKKDVTKNGELSCAFFVSFILFHFKQIKSGHVTVDSTVKDLLKSGWKKIAKPLPGAVLIWEEKDFGPDGMHKHIGFYLGNNQAVSNSEKRGYPIRHHFTYNRKRKVKMILFKQF